MRRYHLVSDEDERPNVMGPRMKRWWDNLTPEQRDMAIESIRTDGTVNRLEVPIPMDFGMIISWSAEKHGNFRVHQDVAAFIEAHS